MFVRRHWIAVLKISLSVLCLMAIPVIFYIAIVQTAGFLDNEIYFAIFTLLVSTYYLFILLYSYANFVDYFLDTWIVTNQRVINIEQKGLFARVIAEKDLARMQDITSEIEGFWPTLLQYGDVHIQTAGEKERFVFRNVPFADEVARKISNLVQDYRKLNKDIEITGM